MVKTARCLVSAAGLLVIAAASAAAGELKGSFTGTAIQSYIGTSFNDPNKTTFDGAAITGTFDLIGTSYTVYDPDPANFSAAVLDGESKLTFNLLSSAVAGTYSYDKVTSGVGSVASLTSTPAEQGVMIFSQRIPFNTYTDSALYLSGTGLFDPADPLTLRPGTIDLANSTTSIAFFQRFNFYSGIQLTSVTFDAAVPEPCSLLILAASLAGTAALRVRRRQDDPRIGMD